MAKNPTLNWASHLVIFSYLCFLLVHATYPFAHNPISNISTTTWKPESLTLLNGMYPILLNNPNDSSDFPAICWGFLQNGDRDSLLLGVFAIMTSSGSYSTDTKSIVLWCANRDKPVTDKAALELNLNGDLVLKDGDGGVVWSTNTSQQSVVGMHITQTGNLVLFNSKNETVWQSFDHPTDTWLPGQRLRFGERLTANVSASNSTPGIYYLIFAEDGLHAYLDSNLPKTYGFYNLTLLNRLYNNIQVFNESVSYMSKSNNSLEFMRLGSDRHLRLNYMDKRTLLRKEDISNHFIRGCAYPLVCGSYGICTDTGGCSCPTGTNEDTIYSPKLELGQPSQGCDEMTQLSCETPQSRIDLLELQNVSYFNLDVDLEFTDVQSCKEACLNNCSCKAAVFRGVYESSGNCSLISKLFSLMSSQNGLVNYTFTTYLKVEKLKVEKSGKKESWKAIVLGSILGTGLVAVIITATYIVLFRKKNSTKEACDNDICGNLLVHVHASVLPRRFTHEELRLATADFHKTLGGGGFGSVFEGVMENGMKVAVKRLDNLGQGWKEFLAEVKTIGSIHHVNLVRLVGFCSENAHKLLVYEHMYNGSLDRWIFQKGQVCCSLNWQTRLNIILDLAKGLSYLHKGCQNRIAHLDIKPQNILLDHNFKAKISDFGLAKLIETDQSQVTTIMRGTRGYLAPEWWLNRRITEKVDVYSFGVVILEMMCGRKNLDYSQEEESDCLLQLVKRKVETDQLFDIVDKRSGDMQQHREEAVKLIKIAIWCVQGDYVRRPSMSMVIKVLEGAREMEPISDYSFLTLMPSLPLNEVEAECSAPPLGSILSGPR